MQRLHISDIERFFQFLSPIATHFSVALMGMDSKSGPLPGFGKLLLTVPEIIANVRAVPESTLHVTLNQTNDRGRQLSDMEYARVFCLDIDKEMTERQSEKLIDRLNPQMVVESSPGKFHMYWGSEMVGGERWAAWEEVQRGLAGMFGGDLGLDSRNHMIRVPGVFRTTKAGEGFLPRITVCTERIELAPERFFESFPQLHAMSAKVLEKRKAANAEIHKKALGGGGLDMGTIERAGMGRNAVMYETGKAAVIGLGRELDEGEIVEVAVRVNGHFPEKLDETEARRAVGKGSKKGARIVEGRRERNEEAMSSLTEVSDASGFSYSRSDRYTALSPYSELGIEGRVLERFGSLLVRVNREVYAFDEKSLAWIPQGKVSDILGDFVRRVVYDACHEEEFLAGCAGQDGVFNPVKYQRELGKVLSARFISSVVNLLRSEKDYISMVPFDFDSSPFLLNCGNGVLDLMTGELREPEPSDYLISSTGIDWDPDATCPEWEKFVCEIFDENEEPSQMVEFIQEVFGYSLTGDMSTQKVFVHYGAGSNGKSKVLSALSRISGRYMTLIGCSVLSKTSQGFAREFERIATLFEGRRCVLIDDLDVGSQWNEAYVKNLTSTRIPSRRLYAEEQVIPNRAKIHIGCNEKPKTQSENEGLIRRLCMIPYPRMFRGNERADRRIEAMLDREIQGILAWSRQGFLRWKKRGQFSYPREVLAETQLYREENFNQERQLANAISELFVPDEDSKMLFSEVKRAIERHLSFGSEVAIITNQKFGMALIRANFQSFRFHTSKSERVRLVRCRKKLENE